MFSSFINSVNNVHLNVWAMFVLLGGVVLVMRGHADIGATLITGGFALLRSSPNDNTAVQPKEQPK